MPVEKTGWQTADKSGTATFTWDYDDGREKLLSLYDKGKRKQWNRPSASTGRHEPDLDNPLLIPDELVPIFGSPVWDKLDREGARQRPPPHGGVAVQPVPARRAGRADLHGEDRADRARHRLEVLRRDAGDRRGAPRRGRTRRYLHDKIELAYPINPNLQVAARRRAQRLAAGT